MPYIERFHHVWHQAPPVVLKVAAGASKEDVNDDLLHFSHNYNVCSFRTTSKYFADCFTK